MPLLILLSSLAGMPSSFVISTLIIVAALTVASARWRVLSRADCAVWLLLLLSVIQEIVAYYLEVKYKNNLISYHIYTPVEYAVVVIYFYSSVPNRRFPAFGILLVSIGAALSIANSCSLQSLSAYNSYFLLFEACIIILLALRSFYHLSLNDDQKLGSQAHFWMTLTFLFYYSLTYTSFGLQDRITVLSGRMAGLLSQTIYWANIAFYASMGLIFLNYRKLRPSGA